MAKRPVEEEAPVLIVGAGPVGLVFAAILLQEGFPVRLIDAEPKNMVHSRAVVVWSRSLELLRRIGVSDALTQQAEKLRSVSYYSGGRRLGDIKASRLGETPYPYALCLPQRVTEEILRNRVRELGGVIEAETTLIGLEDSGPRPTAVLRHPNGEEETLETSWLIGADGSHSTVRRLLDIPFQGTGSDIVFAICDTPLDGPFPAHEMLYCYNKGGAIGLAPFIDGNYRLACSVPVWDDNVQPPRELFQENLDRVSPFKATVGDPIWTTVFRARRRTAANFRKGRCFLVGDAAHIFSAAGSQGMNTGIQDAVNLAWKLVGVARGQFEDRILDTYDAERRKSAERVSLLTAQQTKWGLISEPKKVAVRDALVRGAHASGLLQHVVTPLMSQLTVNYAEGREGASVDIRLRKRDIKPGLRLPVFASLRGSHDIWASVSATGFSVLLWPGEKPVAGWQQTVARIRSELPESIAVDDVAAYPTLRDFLGPKPVLVVVRPDGHIVDVQRGSFDAAAALAAVRNAGAAEAPGGREPAREAATTGGAA